jgi:hypothetical protein
MPKELCWKRNAQGTALCLFRTTGGNASLNISKGVRFPDVASGGAVEARLYTEVYTLESAP